MKSLILGVLLCDVVDPERLHIDGDYPAIFKNLFREHSPPGVEVTLRFYDVTAEEYPEDLAECDGYLTNGAGASVNDDDPWIAVFEEFVRRLHRTGTRLFAICFGHQMIAKALGGRVATSERGWGVGVQEVTVVQCEPWMNPPATSFRILCSHQDQVVDLPPEATLLGSNAHCPVSLFRCDSLVGIQGHPEFSIPYVRALLDSRAEVIPEDIRIKASESFGREPDRGLLAAWMVAFFRDGSPDAG